MQNKSGAGTLLWLVTISLIIYTATRSYDLITMTMPDGQQIAGFFALAALDGGLLAWLFFTTRSSAPGAQRTIGTLMIVIDLAGIAAAVLADTLMNFDPTTKDTIGITAVWLVGIVIVSNIAGTVAAEVTSPDQQIRDAERAVTYELKRQKSEHLTTNAPEIAASVAAAEARHWASQAVAAFSQNGHNGNGAGKVYQKDMPEATGGFRTVQPSEADDYARAKQLIEDAGGRVTSPKAKKG